ncbi:MAG TPA: Ni/Fe hydrogenase subunit alpha [Desulfotignum sp.]|nr:Ni/Fe hydrogenase subunit alpha [Desulfotignum sp.]
MTEIKIHHLTRVEGHGELTVHREKSGAARVRFSVVEAPRFFEVLLQDKDFREVTHIASRVCGICAVSHKCAALKATESAMNIPISTQTEIMRRIAFYGEVLSSHILHIYFLAGPDFMNIPALFSLLDSEPELVQRAVRLKELGYALCDAVAGRHTHPVAMTAGGFSFVPAQKNLRPFKDKLHSALKDLEETVQLFKLIRLPDLSCETEYVSLKHPDHYAFYDGDLYSSEGKTVSVQTYRDHITERIEAHSTAKYARWHRPEYMVGALARFNNNHDQLSPKARSAAAQLGLQAPCFNPFMITTAQIVECIHCVEDSLHLVNLLLEKGIDASAVQSAVSAAPGTGVGAVEAPRGTLFHEYAYDDKGQCLSANLVIPTAQNLGNLEKDLQTFQGFLADADDDILLQQLGMLVRAYDPCISCSTH